MLIDQKTFVIFLPPGFPFPFWVAHGICKKVYCGRMTGTGICPEQCSQCEARLRKAAMFSDARNPEALFTYRLKQAYAEAQEQGEHKGAGVALDPYGRPDTRNPFEVILESATKKN